MFYLFGFCSVYSCIAVRMYAKGLEWRERASNFPYVDSESNSPSLSLMTVVPVLFYSWSMAAKMVG